MSSIQKRKFKALVADEVRFFRSWMGKPLSMGSVTPSGKALTKLMASFVDPDDTLPIIELGPGTGVVTQALLERGVAPERIVSIEYSPDFCRLLEKRFTGIRIIQGDAYALDQALAGCVEGPVAAVISSLPLLTQPPQRRSTLISDAFARLSPGRPFIQFSYGLNSPVPPDPALFSTSHTGWVMKNVPPARVWVYRRTH
ncbi:class I SAM-dependent methyltransferase [Kaistia terrae]|jgi:phosphatidylethanolamine/phosphatidyl-N-methylethanolamine N-methyltransferase|uniref:Class I SAM-dependent methyltransferase n=1 Tax=Kaistia terrae TaxID=537017 RepID=A0ABW0PXJ1_9HYPH|nr:methyltransferase domain-containing protein [Kaistia terrae]MCX5580693.1 methyltransferase domain-containing protein [Kaistia terrae]